MLQVERAGEREVIGNERSRRRRRFRSTRQVAASFMCSCLTAIGRQLL